jgi:transcriptional regulator with XRE-family HTH domain
MTPQDLRLMRKKARISLKALAREFGMALGDLRKIETGQWWPQSPPLRDWADFYAESLIKLTGPVAERQTQPTQNRLRALQTPDLQVQVLPGLPTN